MKLLGLILLALFVTISLTLLAIKDPGYVLIARAPWSVEMPLTLFAVLALLAVLLLYGIGYMVVRTWMIPRYIGSWRKSRKARAARESLNTGLLYLAEGRWLDAEARLLSDLRNSDMPLINYLGAAYAAQQRGAIDKRDEYLSEAQKRAPEQETAVAGTQAQLQQLAQQYEQALATLTELRQKQPKHPYVLALLLGVHRALKDWRALAQLLPEARKLKALDEDSLTRLEMETHRALLALNVPGKDPALLHAAWDAVPKSLRQQPDLLANYVQRLIDQKAMDEAEQLLRQSLNRQWDETLAAIYGRVTADPDKQIEYCEKWQKDHSGSAGLLSSLGQLQLRQGLLDSAARNLQKAANMHPTARTWLALGKALEKQGKTAEAMDAYRSGLKLAEPAAS